MFVVQFSKDGQKFRVVPYALFDGYSIGDRLLEGVMFKVSVGANNKVVVKATDEAIDYLVGNHLSVKKWEKVAEGYLSDDGYDNLCLDTEDAEWDTDELHLSDNLETYLEQGLVQEK